MESLRQEKLVYPLLDAALEAGAAIMAHFGDPARVRAKDDASPVSAADEEAEAIILAALDRLCPEVPVVAEEMAARGKLPQTDARPFFLVDPLDGTKDFLGEGDAFTVNIALVVDRRPVLGVVYAPARDLLFWGTASGAFLSPRPPSGRIEGSSIRVREAPGRIAIVASRSHRTPETDAFIAKYKDAEIVSISSSLKFCLIAQGKADLYPRFGPTMEWDTAAGQAVLEAAGGDVVDARGQPFLYRKPDFRNGDFIARGDRTLSLD